MRLNQRINSPIFFVLVYLACSTISCSTEPQPIKLGDVCSFCKMGVADKKFGAELITKKGKVFKFDDIHCLLEFKKENSALKEQVKDILFIDFESPNDLLLSSNAYLLSSENLKSPMGGNIAAFKSEASLKESQRRLVGTEIKWSSLEGN